MADTLIEYEDSTQTGKTLYALARNVAGQWLNGTTPETYNAAHWTNYAIALAETGASGYFTASTPALPAGAYVVGVRLQAGGSAAVSDLSLGGFTAYWDGSGWHNGPDYVDLLAAGATPPTAAAVASAVWQDTTTADFTVLSSIGKSLAPATLGTVPGAAGGLFIAGANAATTVNFTGSLSGSVGSISGVTFPTNFGSLAITSNGYMTEDEVILSGTPSTPYSVNSVKLLGGSTTTNFYAGCRVQIMSGTGAVQERVVLTYTGSTHTFQFDHPLLIAPDATSVVRIKIADETAVDAAQSPIVSTATVALIATGVWTDITAGDFLTTSSPGFLLMNELATMLQIVGSGPNYQFTAQALALGCGSVTVGGYASGQDPATLVLDVAASGHNTAGTIGAKINSAAVAGSDPWLTLLPGAYTAGEAGNILGHLGVGAGTTAVTDLAGGLNRSPAVMTVQALSGSPIQGATVTAYNAAAYTANPATAAVLQSTTTNSLGGWTLNLPTGEGACTLIFAYPNDQPATGSVTV